MIQLHIFTIFMFKRVIRLFPSMSIQILVYFYSPDRPSARMKCDYARANVRDFWRCRKKWNKEACPYSKMIYQSLCSDVICKNIIRTEFIAVQTKPFHYDNRLWSIDHDRFGLFDDVS